MIRVIEAAIALDEEGARKLASARHPAADREYSKAWDRWLAELPKAAHNRNQDHASTLLIPGAGTSGSPIGHGFAVVWHMLRKSARLRGRAESFAVDDPMSDRATVPMPVTRKFTDTVPTRSGRSVKRRP